MVFKWESPHISGFYIGAPIEYAHSILHVSDHLPPYVGIACDDIELPHTKGHTSNP